MQGAVNIEWNDAMLTGVADIDQQHRVLVDTLIEARARLTADVSEPVFEQVTRDLLAYAIYHFATEESLMQEYGYADAAPDDAGRHRAAHRGFSSRVVSLRAATRRGEAGSREALLAFLQAWLFDHIMTVDKSLGQFIDAAESR